MNVRHARKAFWLRHLRQWHWVSSAICLIGMLLFALTGITLNHAGQIEAHPTVLRHREQVPAALLAALAAARPHPPAADKHTVPPTLSGWLRGT